MSEKIPEKNLSLDDIRSEIEKLSAQSHKTDPASSQDKITEDKGKHIANESNNFDEVLGESKIFVEQDFQEAKAILVSLVGLGLLNILTPANLSVVSGKPKSGKTSVLAILIVAVYKSFGTFKGNLPDGKQGIIFLDFEMGSRRTQSLAILVCRLLGVETLPRNIQFFSLRKFDTTTRLSILEYISFQWKDTAVIFCDGVRDLVHSINDEYEVSKLMEKLLRIIEQTNLHLCSVLHQNKGDRNLRGTLGTELANKSELVFGIEKKVADGETTFTVKPDYSRELEFTAFAFRRTEDSIEIIQDWKPSTKKPALALESISVDTNKAILAQVFSQQTEYAYAEIVDAVQAAASQHLGAIGKGKAKELVSIYFDQKFFSTRKDGPKTMYRLRG